MVQSSIYPIYDARREDVRGILAVRRVTWLATYPNQEHGITEQDIRTNLDRRDIGAIGKWQKRIREDTQTHTWVAKAGDTVVGFVSAGKEEPYNVIKALYVNPKHQHQGIGQNLMVKALEWLGDARDITLEVVTYNKPAIDFYKRFGFAENGPTTCEAGNLPNGKHLPEMQMIKKFS